MFVETGQQIYQELIRQSSETDLGVNSTNKERRRARKKMGSLCGDEKELQTRLFKLEGLMEPIL